MQKNGFNNNSILNSKEYVLGKAKLKSYPRMIFVELTRRCNLNCICCRPEKITSHEFDMQEDTLSKIETDILPYVEGIDFRGWGESTLDSRLPELIERWHEKKKIFLYTNCQTTNEEYWAKMFSYNMRIAISLRSGNKERYETFLRGASFEKLERHLKQLPIDNNIIFTCVIGDENVEDLDTILVLANKYNVHEIHLNPLVERKFSYDYPTTGFVDRVSEAKVALINMQEKAKQMEINVYVCADLFSRNVYDLGRCIHPWAYVYVQYDGKIGFCDHLMCVEDAVTGNINENKFADIWNCDKYQEIRSRHVESKVKGLFGDVIQCDWCYHNRYSNWEDSFENAIQKILLDEYLKMLN